MTKVNSYQELSKLIFSFLKKGVLTNTFISKEDFEKEINFGSLFYFTSSAGLWLVRAREEFYIVNYYLTNINFGEYVSDTLKAFNQEFNKTIILEIVGKNCADNKFIEVCDFFEKLGMDLVVERERLAKKQNFEVTNSKFVDNVENVDAKFAICEIPDFESVSEILEDNFDKFYGCIPSKELLIEEIKDRNIYKATIDNNNVGILHIRKDSKSAEIRHLAIIKEARNKGIASALLKYYDNDVASASKTVWAAKDNTPAQKVYEKNGYQKDGYISRVFCLQI